MSLLTDQRLQTLTPFSLKPSSTEYPAFVGYKNALSSSELHTTNIKKWKEN